MSRRRLSRLARNLPPPPHWNSSFPGALLPAVASDQDAV